MREIKRLWPGTVLVTGKPRHSESNGGVERRNRTVEEKIANWMHENNSTQWSMCLPFIQWRCNTQQHRGIGNRTPYHLTFGQNPQVGISNLPISPELLGNLRSEIDIHRALGLSVDVPLEKAILGQIKPPSTPMNNSSEVCTNNTSLTSSTSKATQMFKLTPDVTERLLAVLVRKCTVIPKDGGRPYFGWKGFGFQVGVCFDSLPSHVRFLSSSSIFQENVNNEQRKESPEENVDNEQRKGPPEPLPEKLTQTQHDPLPATQTKPSQGRDEPVIFPLNKGDSLCDEKMSDYSIRHRWLNLLRGLTKPIDVDLLASAKIRSCFPVVDNPTNDCTASANWRRVIIRKIAKKEWEILDEHGESVLDTVTDVLGEEGPIAEWGVWYRHPTLNDYDSAVVLHDEYERDCLEKKPY